MVHGEGLGNRGWQMEIIFVQGDFIELIDQVVVNIQFIQKTV